jgi:hypothetical protein
MGIDSVGQFLSQVLRERQIVIDSLLLIDILFGRRVPRELRVVAGNVEDGITDVQSLMPHNGTISLWRRLGAEILLGLRHEIGSGESFPRQDERKGSR